MWQFRVKNPKQKIKLRGSIQADMVAFDSNFKTIPFFSNPFKVLNQKDEIFTSVHRSGTSDISQLNNSGSFLCTSAPDFFMD